MKKLLAYFVLTLGVIAALFFAFNAYIYNEKQGDGPLEVPPENTSATVTDTEIGIEFEYRKGSDGYALIENEALMSTSPDFIRGYEFILESDLVELRNATEPREGPPVLMIRAYENTQNLGPNVWATQHPLESNVGLAFQEPVETTVGGAKAISYTADGLYATNTYVVTNGTYVFILTGSYIDDVSPMKADFETLVDSVSFIK